MRKPQSTFDKIIPNPERKLQFEEGYSELSMKEELLRYKKERKLSNRDLSKKSKTSMTTINFVKYDKMNKGVLDMGKCNYRVVRKRTESTDEYQVYEVYYDDNGKIDGNTIKPIQPYGNTLNELKGDLKMFFHAFRLPVLIEEIIDENKTLITDEDDDYEVNDGHYFELMDRTSIVMEHFDIAVASSPILKHAPELKRLADDIDDKLAELYQKAGNLCFDKDERKIERFGNSDEESDNKIGNCDI